MTKIRLFIFLLTLIFVISLTSYLYHYAKGYRLSFKPLRFTQSGLLVVKSNPDGGQVFINDENGKVTNTTLSLPPSTYEVIIKKEGYKDWKKTLEVQKEIVTEAEGYLFKSAPSLSPLTYSPTTKPVPSRDFTKLAYIVYEIPMKNEVLLPDKTKLSTTSTPIPTVALANGSSGLWVMEQLNLPLGFSRDPRKITDGNLENADVIWSPDGRQILLTINKITYLLPVSEFTPENLKVDVTLTKDNILDSWKAELVAKLTAQTKKLPENLQDILTNKAESVVFSPDEQMILYTASTSSKLSDNLIKQLPGASTQKQERDLKKGSVYVYDTKEDRNFLITSSSEDLIIEGGFASQKQRRLSWFPSSRHLVLAQEQEIIIMDYDGTNRQTVYSGAYNHPFAFSTLSTDRLTILTNLGASSNPPNLYSLTLR